MELNSLTAISPIDGRYRKQLHHIDEYFSEFALMKYRVLVEVEYFHFLADKKFLTVSASARNSLRKVAEEFSAEDANEIKATEAITNHDVKAVEYFVKKKLDGLKLGHLKEWVHFGLTSQDINNTSIPLSWKHAVEFEYLPSVLNLNTQFRLLATDWQDVPMLAHTHGQPASPTRLGKEVMVFVERIQNAVEL